MIREVDPAAVDMSLDLRDGVSFELVEEYDEVPDVGLPELRDLYEDMGADVDIDETGGGVTVKAEAEDAIEGAAAIATSLVLRVPGGEARLREAIVFLDLEDEIRGFQ